MPVTPTYPGVYIEEIPSGVRTITGVATSIVAFVGYFTRGFMDKATRVLSMADFERKFGGLCAKSEASYAIGQFFLNGGSEAWIVRTAKAGTAKAAAVKLKDKADAGGTALLLATAASEGAWGNGVRIDVDYGTTDPSKTFNLVVTECAVVGGKLQTVTTETFRNLIIDKTKPNHVVDVVKEASKLINLELLSDPNSNRPAQTGTISKAITGVDIAGLLAAETMGVSLNGTALGTFSIGVPLPSTHVQLASTLQAKIRAVDSKVARASVKVAGSMATLRGVQKLEYLLTDQENGTLNPLGVNCLRKFDVYGNVCWGGRTMDGADQTASEWKYLPVRRIALFLEESLYRGTKWVVFEPNDEPLWAQIRLNAGAFMHDLFRKGAFAGKTPREAYFVKCDKETTTQNDINLGVVNILVGFAPLKPAEFVIIKIQQMAGEIQG